VKDDRNYGYRDRNSQHDNGGNHPFSESGSAVPVRAHAPGGRPM